MFPQQPTIHCEPFIRARTPHNPAAVCVAARLYLLVSRFLASILSSLPLIVLTVLRIFKMLRNFFGGLIYNLALFFCSFFGSLFLMGPTIPLLWLRPQWFRWANDRLCSLWLILPPVRNTDGSLSEQILSTSAFIRLVKSLKTSHQLLLYKDINIYNTQKKLIKKFGQ